MKERIMRGLVASFLGTLVMACSGCGGGGGGSNPEPVSKAPTKPVQISAAGDSTMAGVVKNADGSYTVTDATRTDLQIDLQAQLGPTVTVVANAHSGATLANLLTGNGFPEDFAAYLAKDKSQIVVENFGINDNVKTSPDEFRAELIQFIALMRAAGKIPVLEEPNPLCDPTAPPSQNVEWVWSNRTISTFVDIIDSVAAQQGVPVVKQYSLVKALPNWCSMMSDGWGHPSRALYAIKAQNEAAVLAPIVKGLL
jgi:lysophospholipase L1-like esterase